MYATVRQSYKHLSMISCSGREFIKGEYRLVPPGYEEEAAANPFLLVSETDPDPASNPASNPAPGASTPAADLPAGDLTVINGIGPATAVKLINAGYATLAALADADPSVLAEEIGIPPATAKRIILNVLKALPGSEPPSSEPSGSEPETGAGESVEASNVPDTSSGSESGA